MTTERTESIAVVKAIVQNVVEGRRVVGQVVGSSRIDEQGQWILGLGLDEPSGGRDIELMEGDEFEFAGATWRVDKVYEPSTRPRGSVADLVRVSQSEN